MLKEVLLLLVVVYSDHDSEDLFEERETMGVDRNYEERDRTPRTTR